jgi:hypothetical protein
MAFLKKSTWPYVIMWKRTSLCVQFQTCWCSCKITKRQSLAQREYRGFKADSDGLRKEEAVEFVLWMQVQLLPGFIVKFFFISLSQLLSTFLLNNSHFSLYMGTFWAITSDWSKHQNLHGIWKLLFNVALSCHFWVMF